MKKYNIGFIGCGKMASAIIKGLLTSGYTKSGSIIASQIDDGEIEEKSKKLGIKIVSDNNVVVKSSDIIIIAVKPNQVLNVLDEMTQYITSNKLIVSIAAGITTNFIESKLPKNSRVVRVMPNTPVLLNEGMSAIITGKNSETKDLEIVRSLFDTVGKTLVLENEAQMDIVTAISGSGPAFFYKIINEIALAGKKLGLDYEKSLLLSIQTAIGSSKMAMNRDVSMEQLVSNVATKGGCTRVGVDEMNDAKTLQIFERVIEKTTKKASELGQ